MSRTICVSVAVSSRWATLVSGLRRGDSDVSLARFVEQTGHRVEDVYKKS